MTEGAQLEDLVADAQATGIDPAGPVTIVAATWSGAQAVELVYRDVHGNLRERLVFRSDEGAFRVAPRTARAWSFDADGHRFRLAAEARRIALAHLFDPYLALTSSLLEPLPHQIEAVYGTMLPRHPLRFLLADDPGAGKTIMAGLYLKELMIRGDAERCLVVAPGSLVTQWQEELADKFGLAFDIVTKTDLDAVGTTDVFATKPRLIARVDQLARRDDVVARLGTLDWDVVIVDEAHRLSAHFYGQEVRKTKKYLLGEVLGATTRHLLLMTATPHSGSEEDFQLFLALLDADRFEGRFRDGVHAIDPSDLMRRMVKEKLLTFEGTPLFPERRATTVQFELSAPEMALYDEVTDYVREQMNRADRLTAEGQGRRGNTVGFALTLLQRRLASSPEAIFQSLARRRKRLEARVVDEQQRARAAALRMTPSEERLSAVLSLDAGGDDVIDPDAWDDLDGAEREELEAEVVDAATAAATVAELEAEIATLATLEALARRLTTQGVDAKWVQLSELLSQTREMFDARGARRKLLVFTEHRDTLNYLVDRLRTFLGDASAVVAISGSTPREERRAIQARFTQDESALVLVATDAAGEGINLQRAHLVINYDLPWNPNRIEQRFGRVHRIGQTEVCHMWNLVAADTREAQVYLRLLDKIETQRRAYAGQVFDVLGEALSGRELRGLLIDAIRYGEQPEVRARIDQVIDATVGDRVRAAIERPPLATETLAVAEVDRIRTEMADAAARRLQPHYIGEFFAAAIAELGGSLREREPGRYSIPTVPPAVRARDRQIGTGAPVLTSYARVTFDKELIRAAGAPPAELISPGHPLLDAVVDLISERYRGMLTQGTVLVDDKDLSTTPRVLVLLEHAIADGRSTRHNEPLVVSRRFEFVEVPEHGEPRTAGSAPYLDYRPLREDEVSLVQPVVGAPWLRTGDGERGPKEAGLEEIGLDYAIEVAVPRHLAQVRLHTENRVDATLAAVRERLLRAVNYWDQRANELQLRADAGRTPQMNVDRARDRAARLAERLEARTAELQAERTIHALPPKVAGGALIVPAGLVAQLLAEAGAAFEDGSYLPDGSPTTEEGRRAVERRAVEAVLRAEEALGYQPVDLNVDEPNHPGYDIHSSEPAAGGALGAIRLIEVKGRIAGSATVTISKNEMLTALNEPDRFILALVSVSPDGPEHDEVRYVRRPFENWRPIQAFETVSVNRAWAQLWKSGSPPS